MKTTTYTVPGTDYTVTADERALPIHRLADTVRPRGEDGERLAHELIVWLYAQRRTSTRLMDLVVSEDRFVARVARAIHGRSPHADMDAVLSAARRAYREEVTA